MPSDIFVHDFYVEIHWSRIAILMLFAGVVVYVIRRRRR